MARVAMYYPWIYLKSGVERTIVELKRRSRHEIEILTSHYDRDNTYEELAGLGVREVGHVSVERTYGQVAKAAWTLLNLRLDPESHDALVIHCDGLGPLLTFRNRRRPVLNLVYTPLRAVYDEEYRARLMATSPVKRGLRLAAETVFRAVDRRAWRRFASVIAISATTRDRIVAGGLWPAERILVASPGIPRARIAPSGGTSCSPGGSCGRRTSSSPSTRSACSPSVTRSSSWSSPAWWTARAGPISRS